MRYRALDVNGDYTFGQGVANFLIDSPACVGQSVLTRLKLWEGEWFLDVTEGTPWFQDVLGTNTKDIYDLAIQQRILGTTGVKSIVSYVSELNGKTRHLSVQCRIQTNFGTTLTFSETIPLPPTQLGPSLDFSQAMNSMYLPLIQG